MKDILTTAWTRSTNALNVGKLQRLFKTVLLEPLVTVLPAENSLILPAPLPLTGGSGVETGSFSFFCTLNGKPLSTFACLPGASALRSSSSVHFLEVVFLELLVVGWSDGLSVSANIRLSACLAGPDWDYEVSGLKAFFPSFHFPVGDPYLTAGL